MRSASILSAFSLVVASACVAGPVWTLLPEPPDVPNSAFFGSALADINENGVLPGGEFSFFSEQFAGPSAGFDDGNTVHDAGCSMFLEAHDVADNQSAQAQAGATITFDGDGDATLVTTVGFTASAFANGAGEYTVTTSFFSSATLRLEIADFDPALLVRIRHEFNAMAQTIGTWEGDLEDTAQTGITLSLSSAAFADNLGFIELPIGGAAQVIDASGEGELFLPPGDVGAGLTIAVFGGHGSAVYPPAPGDGGTDLACSIGMLQVSITLVQFCPGDTDGDDTVDFADLNEVVGSFNATGPLGEIAGDINGDGVVNFTDLNLVLANYGQVGC